MSYLVQPFQFGKITLPNNIFYAPLAGCSDYPFRQMSAKYRPGLMCCEMVKMDALVRYDQNTFHFLDYEKEMHPISAQLCGSKPKLAGKAAKILEELGFDVIDFNCGCPVDKVTKDGSGSGMLKNPDVIGEILTEMVNAVKVPVTVKIRAGWDEDSINGGLITKIAEEVGAQAITVHGRTRKQAYKGPANWDYIKECVEAANHIKVIGNGDVFDADSAKKMFAYTGCDAILVARGTMGQPWIVEDIIRNLMNEPVTERDMEEQCRHLLEHFDHITKYQCQRRAIVDMRRIGCWYLKKSAKTKDFRGLISRASSLEEIRLLIDNLPTSDFGEADAELNDSEVSQDVECC